MDIYRFFHPHHNPRLHNTCLRQQELNELAQSASELRKALERAQLRCRRKSIPPIMGEHFDDIIKAARFIENSVETLCDAHPGDSMQELRDLINERSGLAGWRNWTALLGEQLASELASGISLRNGSPENLSFGLAAEERDCEEQSRKEALKSVA